MALRRLVRGKAAGYRSLHAETAAVAPAGWVGPRGNFAPAGAQDALRDWPECTQTLFTSPPGLTNLDTGAPGAAGLTEARDAYVRGVAQWAQSPDSHLALQYGPTRGSFEFRSAVAALLSREYAAPVGPERLMQTTGATGGLQLMLMSLFGAVDAKHKAVFIEDPTYFLAPKMFREAGFSLAPVRVDAEGLDVDALEDRVLRAKRAGQLDGAGPFAGVVYCIPTFHNPTSAVLPAARRRRLVALCQRHRLLCISDDVYELLRFGPGPARLVSFDTPAEHPDGLGHVASNSTFSKIMGPGVRCGWVEAAPALCARLASSAAVASGGASAQLTGQVLAQLCRDGTQSRLLHDAREELAARARAVHRAFAAAPAGCRLSWPRGGMCLWLECPASVDMHEVLIRARVRKVSFKPGDLFSPSGQHRNCARLVVAHYDQYALFAAVTTLCEVLHEFC